jgi:uncharacterized protein DUF4129
MRFDGGGALSTSEFAFVVMLVAVVAVLAVGVGTAAVGGAYAASGDNRRRVVGVLMLAALLGAIMALLFMSPEAAVDGGEGVVDRRRPREPVPADDYFGLSDGVYAGIAAAVIAAVVSLAAAFVAFGVVGAAQRRREDVEPPVDEEEAVMQAVEESLDDLRRERDVRRAIIACYARMERALAYAGSGRRPAEAPFEYLVRILERVTANAPAARALTDLFERAKFSTEPMGEREKQQAIDALELLRAELIQPR